MNKLAIALSLSSGVFLLSSANSSAQTTTSDSVAVWEQEIIPVEIKAIRAGNKSPYAVTNLDEENIRLGNLGQDIPYILHHTPSTVVSSDAGAGVGYTGLRIRGTDASRINFTINGIPVNDAESQAALFVDFPDLLSSTQSIQVQRGVGASTNGSGAFGASVNMSNLAQSEKAFAEINNSFGSFNTWKHTVRAGSGLLKGGFQFDVRASKITSDGYIKRSAANLKSLQFIAGWTSKDERSTLRFNLFTGVEKTGQAWNGVPEALLDTDRRYNGLGLKEDGTYYEDQTDNYKQDYYQLFFDHQFNSNWSAHAALFLTRGKGFYNEYRLDETFADYSLAPFVSPSGDTFTTTNLTRQLWLDNYYYGSVYSINYKKEKTDLIIGGALTRYDGEHYGFVTWANYGMPAHHRWYNLDSRKTDFNIYAKLQQQIGTRLFAFADIQYRMVDYRINGFRKNPDILSLNRYHFVNPKVGLSYITAQKNGAESKAYLSFAMANKEPNRDDFEASPEQKPLHETLYNTELGYQYRQQNWSMAANIYHMQYQNQLILTGKINDVGSYTRTNVDKSFRAGIELSASTTPMEWLHLAANATWSQNKIIDFEEYIDDFDNGGQLRKDYAVTDIAFSPNLMGSLLVRFEPFYQLTKQRLLIDMMGKFVGRQYLDNTGNPNRSINPYSLADLRFHYSFQPKWITEAGLTLALNNVLNKRYEANGYTFSYLYEGQLTTENYYFPQAGFNFMLGLQLRF